ncbi:MAG: hypothetical protein ACJAVT_002095 [Yoonia sp.]|jgi:hypothetical protein
MNAPKQKFALFAASDRFEPNLTRVLQRSEWPLTKDNQKTFNNIAGFERSFWSLSLTHISKRGLLRIGGPKAKRPVWAVGEDVGLLLSRSLAAYLQARCSRSSTLQGISVRVHLKTTFNPNSVQRPGLAHPQLPDLGLRPREYIRDNVEQ